MHSRNIVVVGGGFAGTAVMQQLAKELPAGWRAVLLSEENYMLYTPLLPEVVGGSLLPTHCVAPLRHIVKRQDYRRGVVTGSISLIDRYSTGSEWSGSFLMNILSWPEAPWPI